ncbi:hypothetical protein [Bradyrhizobium sp. S69]|uniref:hypothetical protein n=1 Tax=Bradyrhizobium sp. S69 TaxID=1641856 RepID=UPI00131C371C|nr:hypothetical protein [Bradyrhizobium sp. S69]
MAAIFESQGRRFPAAFFVIGIPGRVILLHCKRRHAAMQTKQLRLVSGIPNLLSERSEPLHPL